MLVGQLAMDNRGGKSNIQVDNAVDKSKFGVSKVGLLELAAPVFDNRGGQRNLSVGKMANAGDHSSMLVGQLAMNNQKGQSNINVGDASDTSKFGRSAIGLMELTFDNRKGQRNLSVGKMANAGEHS